MAFLTPSAGLVERPATGDLLFIPQKPYLLLGSLREQLCYPSDQDFFTDSQLTNVMEKVNLPQLVRRYPDLDVKQDWQRILSLGEQQRLAFARLLLNSPRYVVLDEATSALDVKRNGCSMNSSLSVMSPLSVSVTDLLDAIPLQVLELHGNGDWRLLHLQLPP